MAVVVEVADDGYAEALLVELLDDVGDRRRGFVIVDRHADEFRTRAGEGCNLLHGRRNVSRVGIGHRLHHD